MPTRHERDYPLYLYEFRYRCERTGKWRKARYRAELHEIRERYAEFQTEGEPMVINGPAERSIRTNGSLTVDCVERVCAFRDRIFRNVTGSLKSIPALPTRYPRPKRKRPTIR